MKNEEITTKNQEKSAVNKLLDAMHFKNTLIQKSFSAISVRLQYLKDLVSKI